MSGYPRFTRIASAAAVLLLAGLLQACTADKAEVVLDPLPSVMGPGTCPTPTDFPAYDKRPPDRPGPLVPRDTALSVTLCVLRTQILPTEVADKFPYDERAAQPRKLTLRAAEMVEELSALKPFDKDVQRGCTLVGYDEAFSLVVAYENGRQVTVWLDRNCGSAYAEGRDRASSGAKDSSLPGVLVSFLDRYRQQLVTTTNPATIKATACAGQQKIARAFPPDGIGINRGGNFEPFLPDQLIEVTACRYDQIGRASCRERVCQYV